MEAALTAVNTKRNGRGEWNSYRVENAVRLATLPLQQQKEIESFLSPSVSPAAVPVFALSRMQESFIAGFDSGLQRSLSPTLAKDLITRISADPAAFNDGYAEGCLAGLGKGLRGLLSTLVDLFKLAIALNPISLEVTMIREAALLLTASAHRELRRRQLAEAQKLASATRKALEDMILRPADYVALSAEVGSVLGSYVGSTISNELLSRNAKELGRLTGEILGQILFEIIMQIILLAASEGVGNAARGGIALGEATQGGGRVAQLAARLRPILLRLPGIGRFLEAIGQGREARAALELEAEISRAVEAAFAEGAQFETGVIRVIPVRDPGVVLSAEQLAHWRSLRGTAGLPDRFAEVWTACSNQRAVDSLAEIRRLWALGDETSQLEARRLGRITFNNWRNRFMVRLRDPANAALRTRIEGAGFRFGARSTSTARLVGGNQEALTIDHSVRLMENPARCVDPTNLEFVIGYENSVTLEQLRNFTSADMF